MNRQDQYTVTVFFGEATVEKFSRTFFFFYLSIVTSRILLIVEESHEIVVLLHFSFETEYI